ncbi:MAG: 50S ribosomal protein L25/general stress protein Ctc [Alphaproteobacteria bacterium]
MMSKNYAFAAEKRERAGKGVARALRRDGKIPAVIYGDKKEPIKIALPANEVNVEYNRGHMFTTLCDLKVDGDKHLVLARDVQLNPVTDIVEHVDFLRVTKKTTIAVKVPVQFINEDKSPGIFAKAILNVVRHDVELVCSATNIPEFLEVNLEGKQTGSSVHISDAILPEGTKPVIEGRNFTIATLVAPKTAAQEEAEEAEAAVEDAEGEEAEASEGGEEAAEGAE